MHLLLTDRLTCPRCGPGFGLILLADELVERRVIEGALGCSNCRDRFPIRAGFADLRPPPRSPLDDPASPTPPNPDLTTRLAAMLGVTEGPGNVALFGALAAHAEAVAELVPGIEVVAIAAAARAASERDGVSRLVSGSQPPFQPRTFRALAASGDAAHPETLAALVGPGGHVVLERPADGARDRLEHAGCHVLLDQDGWIVAARRAG